MLVDVVLAAVAQLPAFALEPGNHLRPVRLQHSAQLYAQSGSDASRIAAHPRQHAVGLFPPRRGRSLDAARCLVALRTQAARAVGAAGAAFAQQAERVACAGFALAGAAHGALRRFGRPRTAEAICQPGPKHFATGNLKLLKDTAFIDDKALRGAKSSGRASLSIGE
jgi:hypothetical protein